MHGILMWAIHDLLAYGLLLGLGHNGVQRMYGLWFKHMQSPFFKIVQKLPMSITISGYH
jgi:hypothetical protein